jgi:hypothetical protein
MRCQILAVMAILESQDFSQIDSFAEVFVLLIRRGQESGHCLNRWKYKILLYPVIFLFGLKCLCIRDSPP